MHTACAHVHEHRPRERADTTTARARALNRCDDDDDDGRLPLWVRRAFCYLFISVKVPCDDAVLRYELRACTMSFACFRIMLRGKMVKFRNVMKIESSCPFGNRSFIYGFK